LALLVGYVGCVTYRFSATYLRGNPGRTRFLAWLAITVTCAWVLMLADHLVLLWGAWFLTSVGLHELLTFYRDRPEALPPARKKFLISRLGDGAMLTAFVLIWQRWHTLSLHDFLGRLNEGPTGLISLLIAAAALTKSAQFPFHSWLPETMESPTPVSALMHAGIINAGGALLLKFMPLILVSKEAAALLVGVGSFTAAMGLLCMWAQVKIKRTLAWSTVGQMGFMMVQCGLGVPAAALLHIVGHGLYKAHSFLGSGALPPAAPIAAVSPVRELARLAGGLIVATIAIGLASAAVGFTWWLASEAALGGVLALGLAHLWTGACFAKRQESQGTALRVGVAFLATFIAAFGGLTLYTAAHAYLAPVYPASTAAAKATSWALACVPVLTLLALSVLHALLPALARSRRGRLMYIHALHGFYVGNLADRLVACVWPNIKPQGTNS
jgi:NAD(P)H-quinone oxidoreductase subunit 5